MRVALKIAIILSFAILPLMASCQNSFWGSYSAKSIALDSAVDSQGNVYVAGEHQGTGPTQYAYLQKYNRNSGTLEWTKVESFPGIWSKGSAVCVDSQDRIIWAYNLITDAGTYGSVFLHSFSPSGTQLSFLDAGQAPNSPSNLDIELEKADSGVIHLAINDGWHVTVQASPVLNIGIWQTVSLGSGSGLTELRKGKDGQLLMIGRRLNGVGSFNWWSISYGTVTSWVKSLNGSASYVSTLGTFQTDGGTVIHDAVTNQDGDLFVCGYRTREESLNASELFVQRYGLTGGEFTWTGSNLPPTFADVNVAFGIDVGTSGEIYVAGCGTRTSGGPDRDPVLLKLDEKLTLEGIDFPVVAGFAENTSVRVLSDGWVCATGANSGAMRMTVYDASLGLQYYWFYGSGTYDRPIGLVLGRNEDIIQYGAHRWAAADMFGAFQVAPTAARATNDQFSTQRHTPLIVPAPGILANDFRVTGGTIVVLQSVTQGQLSLQQDGSFTYTPNALHNGSDLFTYRVDRPGAQGLNVATVNITVSGNNLPPVANPDLVLTTDGQAVLIQPIANDSDPDFDSLSLYSHSGAAHGTLLIVSPNSLRYTPQPTFTGLETITYTVTDGQGNFTQGQITVNVRMDTWPRQTVTNSPLPGNCHTAKALLANDGSHYVCGWETNGATIDAVLLKYSQLGALQWRRYANWYTGTWEEWLDVCEAPNGDIYVAGRTQTATQGHAGFAAYYRSDGTLRGMATTLSPGDEGWYGVRVDSVGNVFLAGYLSVGSTGTDGWIRKMSANLNDQLWQKDFTGPGVNTDYVIGLELDPQGNPVVAGQKVNLNHDWYIAEYASSDGTQSWSYTLNGVGNANDFISELEVDSSGQVFAAGNSNAGSSNWDGTLLKLSSSGSHMWTYRYNGPNNGNDGATDLATDPSTGNLAICMESWNPSNQDFAVAKVSPSGAELWSRRYNGPGDGTDIARQVVFTRSGEVYVTGTSFGHSTLGQDAATLGYSPNGDHIWTNRYDANGGNDDSYVLVASSIGTLFQHMDVMWTNPPNGVDFRAVLFQRGVGSSR